MKSKKELLKLYNNAKGTEDQRKYYSFEAFTEDARDYIKDVKKYRTICTINASRSGMSRKFNFDKYNMLLNICYNRKMFWDYVAVSGCGMNMHWHLKFITCEQLLTKKDLEKFSYNSVCSSGKIL